ncbi:MAG: DUF2341 domain-containing protein, partial [bacterium]
FIPTTISGALPKTSAKITPIPTTATITLDNSQSPTTITDTAIDDIIRLNVTNQGTISAGSITFASITLSFDSSLIKMAYVYHSTDTIFSLNDTLVGSSTLSGTLSLSGTQTYIAGSETKYFFVVFETLGSASGRTPSSFSLTLDPDSDCRLNDIRDNSIPIGIYSTNPGSSGMVSCIPKEPTIDVSDVAPLTMVERTSSNILKIDIIHNGIEGAGSIRFGSLTVKFTKNQTNVLSTDDAKAIFKNLFVVYQGTRIGTKTNAEISLVGGTLTFDFASSTDTWIDAASTKTYFLVVELTVTASGASTNTFSATIDERNYPKCWTKDGFLLLGSTTDIVKSTITTIMGTNPSVSVLDNTPSPPKMTEGETESILKLNVINNSQGEAIKFSTLTITLLDGTNTLSDKDARQLFSTITLYQGGIATITQTNIGSLTIFTFDTLDSSFQIGSASTKTYTISASLWATASTLATSTFSFRIDGDIDCIIIGSSSNKQLTINPTDPVTSTTILIQGTPSSPNITITNLVLGDPPVTKYNGEERVELLKIEVFHTGDSKDADIELCSLDVVFGSGSIPLSIDDFKNILSRVSLSSGTTETELFGSNTSEITTLPNGSMTINLPDNNPDCWVSPNSTNTYTLRVKIGGLASEYGGDNGTHTFNATISGTDTICKDANTDINCGVKGINVATSTTIIVQSGDPKVEVSTVTLSYRMTNSEQNDLLMLTFSHFGVPSTSTLELATITIKLATNTLGAPMDSQSASYLLKHLSLWRSADTIWSPSDDTKVATVTSFNLTNGTMAIGLVSHTPLDTETSRYYYFLVAELNGSATNLYPYGTPTFCVIIDGDESIVRIPNDGIYSLQPTEPCTSTPLVNVVLRNPTGTATDSAPAKITEGKMDDLLVIDLSHNDGSQTLVANIRLSTATVHFTSDGITPLNNAANLFGTISLYKDNGNGSFGLGDSEIGSLTSGISANSLIPCTSTISAGSTTRYFLVVYVKDGAAQEATRTFRASMDVDTDLVILNNNTQGTLSINPTETITSSLTTAEGRAPAPKIVITNNVSDYKIKDGSLDDLLRIDIIHTGTITDAAIELATFSIRWTDGTRPLNSGSASSLFSSIRVYGTDTLIKDITNISLSPEGTMSIGFEDGSNTTRIDGASTKTYFLAVSMKADASGTPTRWFNAWIGTETVIIEDFNTDEQISASQTSTSETSTLCLAVPVNPDFVVSDLGISKIKDLGTSAILSIFIKHNGVASAGAIEFATLSARLTNGASPLTSTDCQRLFGTISLYGTNTLIASITTFTLSQNGTFSITLPENSQTQIQGQGSKTFYLVFEVLGTASSYSTKTFNCYVGTDTNSVVEAANDDVYLELNMTPATSTLATIIPVSPSINVYDVSFGTITDGTSSYILGIDVKNNGTLGAGSITLSDIGIRFIGLNTVQAGDLFGTVALYYGTTIVGSKTASFIDNQGWGTISLSLENTISANGSRTYFLSLSLLGTASGNSPRQFRAYVSTQTAIVKDSLSSIILENTGQSGTSALTTAIPVQPKVVVSDSVITSPNFYFKNGKYYQKDTERGDLLKMVVYNNGIANAGEIELSTLTIHFTSDGTQSLTHPSNLFESVACVLDSNANGKYDTQTDTMVGFATTIGSITLITNMDGAIGATITANGSKTYFLVVTLENNASSYTTKTYCATINPLQGDCMIDDNDNIDTLLSLTSDSSLATSTMVEAIPQDPEVAVYDASIGPYRYPPYADGTSTMTDGGREKEDVLRIDLINRGAGQAIEFATLTIKLTDGSNPLTTTQAQALFEWIYIYLDNGNATYEPLVDTDCVFKIGSQAISLDSGTISFGFTEGSSSIQVPALGSKTYFLVMELREQAATQTTNTFQATIDERNYPIVIGSSTRVILSHIGTETIQSAKVLCQDEPPLADVTIGSLTLAFRDPFYVATDTSWQKILEIKIAHRGESSDAAIEFASVTVKFVDENGADTNPSLLFDNVRIYDNYDNDCTTNWNYTSQGTVTIVLIDGANYGRTQINPQATKTYYLRVQLRDDASTQTSRRFSVFLGDGDISGSPTGFSIEDANTDIASGVGYYSGTISSYKITPIPVNPRVDGLDTAPGSAGHPDPPTISDKEEEDVLRISMTHNGVSNAGYIEFGSITIKLTSDESGNKPLTTEDGTNTFERIALYRDDNGDGTWNDTTIVGSVTYENLSFSGGFQVINFTDGDENVKGTGNTTIYYFLCVKIRDNAHSYATNTFKVFFDGDQSIVEDKRDDIRLDMVSVSTVSSTLLTIENDPDDVYWKGSITDIAPGYLKDTNKDALLRIQIVHLGQADAATFEFSTLSVRFRTSGDYFAGTQNMTTQEARNLFKTLYVIADGTLTGTGTYTAEDIVQIGSITNNNLSLDNGSLSFTFRHNDTNTWIEPIGKINGGRFTGTGTYYLVAELIGTASGQATRTFEASVHITGGGTGTYIILNDANNPGNEVSGTDTCISGTSSWTKAIPRDPSILVENVVGTNTLMDGMGTRTLKITITNNGTISAGAIEFATLTLKILSDGLPASSQTAKSLFGSLTLNEASGVEVGSLTNFDGISSLGTISFTLLDGNNFCTITANGSRTYFLSAYLTGTSSGYSTKTFAFAIGTGNVIIEDAKYDPKVLDYSLNGATSTYITAIPVKPLVSVYDIVSCWDNVAGTWTLADGSSTSILKIVVENKGISGAGSITLKSLRVWFGSKETLPMSASELQQEFGTISLFYGGTRVATMTNFSNGIGTFTLVSENIIGPQGSRTYILWVELLKTASARPIKTFVGSISLPSDNPYPFMVDTDDNIRLHLDGTSFGSNSKMIHTIPVSGSVSVANSVATPTFTYRNPYYQKDASLGDLLKFTIYNNGTTNAGYIELATLTAYFEGSKSDALNWGSLTNISSLFGSITIWRDMDGGGTWSSLDYQIGEITPLANQGTITIPDNLTQASITANGSATFFLVVKLNPDASAQATRTYRATIDGTNTVFIEDEGNDLLLLNINSSIATSTPVTAIPINPSATASDTAPNWIRDGESDDLLKVLIKNEGSGETIRLSTMTFSFLEGTNTMGSQTASKLFDRMWIATATNGYAIATITMGSTTLYGIGTLSDNGTVSFTFANDSNVKISAQGSITYWLFVKLKEDASGYATRTFRVRLIDSPIILDDELLVLLDTFLTQGTSGLVTCIPKKPKFEAYNTAPSTITDFLSDDIIKMVVYNQGTQTAGTITFSSCRAIFSAGTASPILFSTISLYCDGSIVGSITNISSYNGTIALSGDKTKIGANGSATYFLVVSLLGTASGASKDTFTATIATSTIVIKDDSIGLELDDASFGTTSTICSAIATSTTIKVGSTSPWTMKDNETDDILKITIYNNGTIGAGLIELATISTRFFGSNSITPLSDNDVLSLVKALYLCKGDTYPNNGTLTIFYTLGSITKITIPEGAAYSTITANGSQTYFLVISLTGTASGYSTHTFCASVHPEEVRIEDESSEYPLPFTPLSNPGTSGTTTAIPLNPSISVRNSLAIAPGYGGGEWDEPIYEAMMSESQLEDLLTITITNNGTYSAGEVLLSTLTIRFCSYDHSGFPPPPSPYSGTRSMTTGTASKLFEKIFIYRDLASATLNPAGTWTPDDLRIATITNTNISLSDNGTMAITITDLLNGTITAGTQALFFLVVEGSPTGSGVNPPHFTAECNGSDAILLSYQDEILLSLASSNVATSTHCTLQARPANPVATLTDMVLSPPIFSDNDKMAILRLKVQHLDPRENSANIRIRAFTLNFTYGTLSKPMDPAWAKGFFKNMWIYVDYGNPNNVYDSGDLLVASPGIDLSPSGTQTIWVSNDRDKNFQITQKMGSKTYFVVLELYGTSSGLGGISGTRSFAISIATSSIRIEDANSNNQLDLVSYSQGATSTTIWAVLEDPAVWIDRDYSGYTLIDGNYASILRLDVCHIGTIGAQPGEFSTLTITFYSGTPGATLLGSMTTDDANRLFSTITLYYDYDHNGSFTISEDKEVASVTTFTLSPGGTMTMTLPEGTDTAPGTYTLLQPGGQGTKTYFLVIFLKGTASSYGTKTFKASIYEGTSTLRPYEDVYCESAWDDQGPLPLTACHGEANNPRFSGTITAIVATPTVKVHNIATSSYVYSGSLTVKDGSSSVGLLKIIVFNNGSLTAGSITLKSLRVWFGSDTTNSLNSTQSATIIGTISLVCEGNIVGSSTNFLLSSGIGTLNLTGSNEIPAAGSKTYILQVDLKPDASATWTKTFVGSISTKPSDTYPEILDTGSLIRYATFTSDSFGSNSTILYIIPVNPTATISDYVPYAQGTYTYNNNVYLRDGSETTILKIEIRHNGTGNAIAIELATLTVYLEGSYTSWGSLTNASSLFEYIRVYRGDSLIAGNISSFSDGTQTIGITANNRIATQTTGTFTLAVKLKPYASGSLTRTFRATIVGTSGVVIRDPANLIILEHTGSNQGTSTKITAIPKDPTLTITDSAPNDLVIRDYDIDDILTLVLKHNGSQTSREIEFATLTTKFYEVGTSGFGTTTLGSETADNLFKVISVYADSQSPFGTWTENDVEVGSITLGENGTLSNNGTLSITLIDGYGSCSVSGQGTQAYFLVVKMEKDASRLGTKTFFATILDTTIIEDRELDTPLSYTLVQGTSTKTTAVPKDPTIKVFDIATSSYIYQGSLTVKDSATGTAILRIDVLHNGSLTSGSITLNSLRIWLGSNTTNPLNTFSKLFGTISIFVDNGNDIWEPLLDTQISTQTTSLTLNNGIGTLALTQNNEIGGAGSKTFFIVFDMKPDASATQTKTFLGSTTGTADTTYPYTDPYISIVDTISQLRLRHNANSNGSNSTILYIIPINPTATVTDNVPFAFGTYTYQGNVYLKDGGETGILKIDVRHNGTAGAIAIEVSTITFYLEGSYTSWGSLTNASSLFEYIRVYRGDSLIAGNISSFSDGTQTIGITANNRIATQTTGTFTLAVKLKPYASGSLTRTFRATIVGTSGCLIRDPANLIPLEHTASTQGTSTPITAIPVNPGLVCTDSAPQTPAVMSNGEINDLLKVVLTHNGTQTAELIEFATITLNFAQNVDGDIPITKLGAKGLFAGVYIYRDTNNNGSWETGDTVVVSDTTLDSWNDNGTFALTFLENETTAGNTQTTYFVVVKIKSDAVENSSVRRFNCKVMDRILTVIEDSELDVPLEFSFQSERCHVVSLESEPWLFWIDTPLENALVFGTTSIRIGCAETPGRVEYWVSNTLGATYSLSAELGTRTIVYLGSGATPFNFEYLWNTKLGTFTDGTWSIFAECFDSAGSSQATDTVRVEIDNTPGTLTIISPTTANYIWAKPGDIITIVYSYTEANPDKLSAKVWDGTTTIAIADFVVLPSGTITGTITLAISSSAPEGSYSLILTLIDKALNTSSQTQTNAVKVDGTPPLFILVDTDKDYYKDSDTMTLTAVLDSGSYTLKADLSALDSNGPINFSLYLSTWTLTGTYTYQGTYTISGTNTVVDGNISIIVKADDLAGNTSSRQTSVILDNTPPLGTIEINQGATYTGNANVRLYLTYDDNTSGVSDVRYGTDGTNWTPWLSPSANYDITLGSPTLSGYKTVWYEIRDKAGNTKLLADFITLDLGSPTCSIRINAPIYWWNTSFTKRKKLTFQGSPDGQLTNFQASITVTYDSDMQNDFDDLRFTAYDGVTPISYWVQTYTTSGSATVWLKIPVIPASPNLVDVYMYYGSSSAGSATSLDNTFPKDYGIDGSCVGVWHMDEGIGQLTDSSGNNNHGSRYGTTWNGFDGGRWDGVPNSTYTIGNSLAFNGVGDYVIVMDSPSLNIFTGPFTVEVWMYPKGTENYRTVLSKWEGGGWEWWFVGNKLQFTSSGGTIETNKVFSPNQWYHIAISANGANTGVYVNGVIDNTGNIGSIDTAGKRFQIATTNVGQYFFNGTIDEPRIYNRALSASEIRAHYERRKFTQNMPTLQGWGAEEDATISPSEPEFTNSRNVVLYCNYSDDYSGVSQARYKDDGLNSIWTSYDQVLSSKPWYLSSAGDGTKTVYYQVKDAVGNEGATSSDTIILDTTSPNIISPSPTGTIGTDTPTIVAYYNDLLSGISTQTAIMRLDGNRIIEAQATSGSITYKITSPLSQGIHNVSVDVADNAGNFANQLNFSFYVDLSAGQVVLDKPYSMSIISGIQTLNLSKWPDNTQYVVYSISSGTTWSTLGSTTNPAGGYALDWDTNRFIDRSGYQVRGVAFGTNTLGTDTHTNITIDNATPTLGVIAVDGTKTVYKKAGSIVDIAYSYTEANPDTLVIEITNGTTTIGRESLSGLSGSNSAIYGTQAITILYTASDGTYSVKISLIDTSGKKGIATLTDSVVIDNIQPSGSITINNNATYTNTGSITYTIYSQGANYYQISQDNVFWQAITQTQGSYSLTIGDGEKWLYARLIDLASNTTTIADSIILDTIAPYGSIIINNNDPYTNQETITLTLTYHDETSGIDKVRYATNTDYWTNWEDKQATKIYNIGTNTSGTYTIYYQIRDYASNTSTYTDTIILDQTSPTGSLTIDGGASHSQDKEV